MQRRVRESGFFRDYEGALNDFFEVARFINIRDVAAVAPPEFLPDDIAAAFREGATCRSVGCYNAAGAMFRMCVDLATRSLLPDGEAEGLSSKVRRDLGLRLPWLFQHGQLSKDLQGLSSCIREDGNDGVHAGTLGKDDADDLIDFAEALLERMYTEPARLKQAESRRNERRNKK
jgi:hypothetical protein